MIAGHEISRELLQALGLPLMVVSFTLRCRYNEPVTVECEYYPSGSFQTALAQYHLEPRVDVTSAEPLHFDTWMRDRTERAHRDFMERTSRRLPCDASPCEVAAYMRGTRA